MTDSWRATNVLIMGAAGRDFHNFNVVYRDDPSYEVVAPTARWLSQRLRDRGLRAAVIRHPMPYGDLEREAVQRFAGRPESGPDRP